MTVEQAYRSCISSLKKSEVCDPDFEAICIFEQKFSLPRAKIIACGDNEFCEENFRELQKIIERRAKKEPLQYILGQWYFFGYEFFVGEGVLIPRDDTEVVTELCLEFLNARKSRKAIDLCAGSGAISVVLQKLANADVTSVELSEKAFSYLVKNAEHNGADIKTIKADIFECCEDFENGVYDLIVSNPPYIKSDEIKTLQAEVQKEPKSALDGGADGLDFYRYIIKHWRKKLKNGGALAFELGENQADYVAQLMKKEGFINIKTSPDLSGIKRAIIGFSEVTNFGKYDGKYAGKLFTQPSSIV